jgi:hypothetical protein
MALDVIIVLAVVFLVVCICAQRARKMILQQQLQQQQQISANSAAAVATGAQRQQLTRSSYRSSQQRNDALSTATLHAVCTRDLERGPRAFSGYAISGDNRSSTTRGSGGLRGLQTARSNMVPHSTAPPRSAAAVPQMTRFEEGAVLVTGIAEARPAQAPIVTVDYTQQSSRGRAKLSLPTVVAVPVIETG